MTTLAEQALAAYKQKTGITDVPEVAVKFFESMFETQQTGKVAGQISGICQYSGSALSGVTINKSTTTISS